MKCLNCGAKINKGALFCDQCGNPSKPKAKTKSPKKIALTITSCVVAASIVTATIAMVLNGNNLINFGSQQSEYITKGEWLHEINIAFGMESYNQKQPYFDNINSSEVYYNDVQTAVEWCIIKESELFDTAEDVDAEYAAITLISAMNYNDAQTLSNQDKVDKFLQTDILNGLDIEVKPDAKIDKPTAYEIIRRAKNMWTKTRKKENSTNIIYADGVLDLTADYDVQRNQTIIMDDGEYLVTLPEELAEDIYEGRVYILPPSNEFPRGAAFKAEAINSSRGTSEIASVPATIEDVYYDIEFSGNYDMDLDEIDPAEGVTLVSEHENEMPTASTMVYRSNTLNFDYMKLESDDEGGDAIEINGKEITLNLDIDEGSVSITLSPDLDFDADAKVSFFPKPKVHWVYAKVNYGLETSVTVSKDKEYEDEVEMLKKKINKGIPLGKVPVRICAGITIEVELELEVTATGELTIACEVSGEIGAEYNGSNIRGICNGDVEFSFEGAASIDVKLVCDADIQFDYIIGQIDLYDLEFGVGPTLTASAKTYESVPIVCVDLKAFLGAYLEAGKDSFVGSLGAQYTKDFWNEDNSPLQDNFHFEDFRRVPECTMETDYIVASIFSLDVKDNRGKTCNNYKYKVFDRIGNEVIGETAVTTDNMPKITLAEGTYILSLDGANSKGESVTERLVINVDDGASSVLNHKSEFVSKKTTAPQNANTSGGNGNFATRYTVLIIDTTGTYTISTGGLFFGGNTVTVGSPLSTVKEAAISFLEQTFASTDDNYIAIITCAANASVVNGFSNDLDEVRDTINSIPENDVMNDSNAGGFSNFNEALVKADELLANASGQNYKHNIVFFSGCLPAAGEYTNEGHYSSSDYDYQVMATGIKVYAHANVVYDTAQNLKNKGYHIYTLGCFTNLNEQPESFAFAKQVMSDISSIGYFDAQKPEDLVFFFDDVADQINGQTYIQIRIACPVDVTVSYNGETLSSNADSINKRTSFGTLSFDGTDDEIKQLRLKTGVDYSIVIKGTGEGVMNYSIKYPNADGEYLDTRIFREVLITPNTIIKTNTSLSNSTDLIVDKDGNGSADATYRAGSNDVGKIYKDYTTLYIVLSVISLAFIVFMIIRKSKNINSGLLKK
jgi:hypothetical protein